MGAGGYLAICNGTPYAWQKTNEHYYQMSSDSRPFPNSVAAFSVFGLYIEFSEAPSTEWSDDEGWADYTIQSPSGTSSFRIWANNKKGFTFAIVLNGMSVLNDPSQTTINLGFAQNPITSPGYNGTPMILSGVDGAFVCSSPDNIGPWMSLSLNYLAERTLRHMCLPLSHDSGMSELTTKTTWATNNNTVTQYRNIGDQLGFGVRAFDIRPAILGGQYYTGHYDNTGEVLGWQGGSGQPVLEIVSQINNFTSSHPELVILNISHDLNVDKGYVGFTQDDWNGLFSLLDGLKYEYKAESGSADLTILPLKTFIGGNQAAVIIRFDFDGTGSSPNLGDRAGNGFFYSGSFPGYYDSYADTDDPDQLVKDQFAKMNQQRSSPDSPVFSLDWTLTMLGADNVSDSLLEWADVIMTPRLGPGILPAVSKTTYPNIIGVDGVKTTDAVAVVTAINCISIP